MEEGKYQILYKWSLGPERFGANAKMPSGQIDQLEIDMPLERFNELCPCQQHQVIKAELVRRLLSGTTKRQRPERS